MVAHRPHPITGPWPFAIRQDRVADLSAEAGTRIPLVDRVPVEGSLIYDDPKDALLYDACDRCDQQATSLLALDDQKLGAVWDRMFHVEREDGHYRTVNERRACISLYLAVLTIARLQGHGNPWKVMP